MLPRVAPTPVLAVLEALDERSLDRDPITPPSARSFREWRPVRIGSPRWQIARAQRRDFAARVLAAGGEAGCAGG
nr:hypothetical protein [Myxococcota bacterium]